MKKSVNYIAGITKKRNLSITNFYIETFKGLHEGHVSFCEVLFVKYVHKKQKNSIFAVIDRGSLFLYNEIRRVINRFKFGGS